MAKQVEEVEVVFTADAEQYNETVEQSSDSTNNFNANLGSFVKASILAGATLLKVNFVMKIFNIQTLLGIQNVTLFNITFISLAKTIANKLIPQFVRLRLAIIATGIGALVVTFGSLLILLNNTVKGSDFLTTAMTALGNIVKGVVEYLTGMAKVTVGLWTGDWELMTEGWSQAWEGVSNNIGNAWDNAKGLVATQRELINLNKTIATQSQDLEASIARSNKELEKVPAISFQALQILGDRLRAEKELLGLKIEIAGREVQELIIAGQTTDNAKELNEKVAELSKLKEDGLITEQKTLQVIKDTSAALNLTRQVLVSINDESLEMLTAFELERVRLAELAETRLLSNYQEYLDKKLEKDATYAAQFEDVNGISLAIVDDLEEEVLDEATVRANKEVKTRVDNRSKLEQQQIQDFEAFKASALQQGFALAATLAKDNQAAQGAIMIGQAIANTAVGITRVLGKPTAAIQIPIIAALGAAQVAIIAKEMGGAASSVPSPSVTSRLEQSQVETAFNVTQPQPQVVLVTEDLNTVQNRVQITEDRASLG